jgi:hypothetical protein
VSILHIFAHALLRLGQAPIVALLMLVIWACERAAKGPRVRVSANSYPTEGER